MNDDLLFALLLTVILILAAWLGTAFTSSSYQDRAINVGVAHYDDNTSEFKFKGE